MHRSLSLSTAVMVAALLTAPLTVPAPAQDTREQAPPPAKTAAGETFAPTAKPLDARVKSPEKITSYDLPPLPEQILQPMPPMFTLANDASQLPIDTATFAKAQATLRKGIDFLAAQQHESGGWMVDATAAPTDQPDRPSPVSVAITALAVKTMVQADPKWKDTEAYAKAMAYIRRAKNPDGSFDQTGLANYVTAAVVSGLSAADRTRFHDDIEDGVAWLKESQWEQGEGLEPQQDWFGGAGYGNHGRPDLSNTQMMLDALHDAGISPDEPVMQKALAFASRAQNLKATNKADWAGEDGGFIYTPANGGESMASEAQGEGRSGEIRPEGAPKSLRSYGSMTYAGFKSLLYAGLSQDDVRVRAAFDWIRNHWTFEENPGLGQQGLFYYYHTLSRALRAAQQNEIVDAQHEKHNWRAEMIDALAKRQAENGSWVNGADRWMEGDPVMVTIYSTLALEEILKSVTPRADEE